MQSIVLAFSMNVNLWSDNLNSSHSLPYFLQGELEEGLKKLQDLVKENPRDFRPYLCQVKFFNNIPSAEICYLLPASVKMNPF